MRDCGAMTYVECMLCEDPNCRCYHHRSRHARKDTFTDNPQAAADYERLAHADHPDRDPQPLDPSEA